MKTRGGLRRARPPQERGKVGAPDRAALDPGALWLPEEAAAFLRVPRSLVMELARKTLLPAVRVGRFVRFRRQELEAWAAKGGTGAAVGGVR